MTQAFSGPVSGAAQAAAARTAHTSAGGSGPPGAGNETPAFSSVLDHHVARTAHAEGQNKTAGDSGGRRSSRVQGAGDKSSSTDATAGTDATPQLAADTAGAQSATPVPQQPASAQPEADAQAAVTAAGSLLTASAQATATSAGGSTQATAAGTAPAAGNFIPVTVIPTSTAQAAATAAAPATQPPTTSATATPTTLPSASTTSTSSSATVDQSALTSATSPPDAGATTATGQPTTPPVIADAGPPTAGQPTAPSTDKARGIGAAAQSSHQQAASPTTTSNETATPATSDTASGSTPSSADSRNGSGGLPQSAAQAPAHAPESSAQSHPDQATPAQAATTTAPAASVAAGPTPQVATSSATAATAAAPGPARYGVGLEHAIETVKTTIELGSRQGFSQAKIQLAPASLGAITIHLQKTSDGIIARVVAEHSAAAQTMQQGGDDLRRSLQSSGMTLLRLDIETRGDQRGSAGENGQTAGSGSGQPGADEEPAAATDNSASQQTTLVLPNGALVNVLA